MDNTVTLMHRHCSHLMQLILSTVLLCSQSLSAQATATQVTAAQNSETQTAKSPTSSILRDQQQSLLLPWQFYNIDADFRAAHRPQLEASRQQLANQLLSTNNNLHDLANASGKMILLNNRRRLQAIYTGTITAGNAKTWMIEPVMCQVKNQLMLALTATNYSTGLHVASDYSFIESANWTKLASEKKLQDMLNQRLATLSATLLAHPPPLNESYLKLTFATDRGLTRIDESSQFCLNLLVINELQRRYSFASQVSREISSMMQDLLPEEVMEARPNRFVTMGWNFESPSRTPAAKAVSKSATPASKPSAPTSTLPMISFNVKVTEAIFAKPLDLKLSGSSNLIISGDKASWEKLPLNSLQQWLDGEKDELKADAAPMIVGIDRAWVFVDKGRAWGLHINDRVVSRENPAIKGHVIGFYGPEKKHKNSAGKLVSDGAILFIRSGQQLTSKGISFWFDPQTYPASH